MEQGGARIVQDTLVWPGHLFMLQKCNNARHKWTIPCDIDGVGLHPGFFLLTLSLFKRKAWSELAAETYVIVILLRILLRPQYG